MEVAWKEFVVGVVGANNIPIGTGFLIAPDYMVTCTHVVAEALGHGQEGSVVEGNEITACLYQQDSQPKFQACVEIVRPVLNPDQLQPETLADIAILKIIEPQSFTTETSVKLDVESKNTLLIRPFYAWGYHKPAGQQFGGQIEPMDANGLEHLTFSDDPGSLAGASGAPIWSTQSLSVVGMLVEAEEEDKRAYMIPAAKIKQLWPHWGKYNTDADNTVQGPTLEPPDLPAYQPVSAWVRHKLKKCLNRKRQRDLLAALANELSLDSDQPEIDSIIDALCEKKANDAIVIVLYGAAVECYRDCMQQANVSAAKQIKQASLELMGCLSLNSLNDQELKKLMPEEGFVGHVFQPLNADAFEIEVLVAGKFHRPVQAVKGEDVRTAKSQYALDLSAQWQGWDEKNRTKELLVQVWNTLFELERKELNNTIDPQKLNEELRLRRERNVDNQHHYLLDQMEADVVSNDWYKEVFKYLPQLTVVRLRSADQHNYFLLPSGKVAHAISALLSKFDELDKKL